MEKFKWNNFIKLIIMLICMIVLLNDTLNIFIKTIQGITYTFTMYGLLIDTLVLMLGMVIYEELFGE